jgi:transposase
MNESSTANTAKRYSEEIKTQVLGECDTAGAVIKAVAQKHGIPISLVHKWRYKAKCHAKTQTGCKTTETHTTGSRIEIGNFVALPLVCGKPSKVPAQAPTPTDQSSDTDIRIELQGGTSTVRVHWPLNAGAQCALWLRELLR